MDQQWWNSTAERPTDWPGCVVTIGVFEGFHRGHQTLVKTARRAARKERVPLVLLTFDPHPRAHLRPETAPRLLMSIPQRVQTGHAYGDPGRGVSRPGRLKRARRSHHPRDQAWSDLGGQAARIGMDTPLTAWLTTCT
ncbi:MAG: hypothetical protein ACRDSE_10945 [Pseudonocardiaceae bacterium]